MRTRVRSGFEKNTVRGVSDASACGAGGAVALAVVDGWADATGATGLGDESPHATTASITSQAERIAPG